MRSFANLFIRQHARQINGTQDLLLPRGTLGRLSPTSCWPLIVLDHASFLSPSPSCNRKIFLYILFNFSMCAEHTGAKRNTSITMKLCR